MTDNKTPAVAKLGVSGPRLYPFALDLSLLRRILEAVTEDEAGCWVWQRATSGSGYARISISDRLYMAHRVLYTMLVGPIDPSLDLDHLCRERLCVNPQHLEPVTRSVNLRRGQPHSSARRAESGEGLQALLALETTGGDAA